MNILNVEKVSKAFGEKVLLDNVTLGINKGDKIGIIGVNGTGKSTLLKIIAGIEEPDEGNIIKGRKVTVTYLAQSPDYIKDENVLSYVLRGKDSSNEPKAKEILNKLGIDVYDAPMDKLSGGQKKNGGDDYYLSVFRNHFKPQLNYNGRYMFMISDKDKNIIVNVQGSNLTVEFGQDMEADVIGKMSKETFDRIVQGRITFHRAFMTGDMTAKGNFRTLRMLDEVFNFED